MATCYKNTTYCREDSCARFGEATDENGKCDRSLTKSVKQAATLWWMDKEGNENAPISVYSSRPSCFMTVEVNEKLKDDENSWRREG